MGKPTKSQTAALRRLYDEGGSCSTYMLPEDDPKTGHKRIHGHTVKKLSDLDFCSYGYEDGRPVFLLTAKGWRTCETLWGKSDDGPAADVIEPADIEAPEEDPPETEPEPESEISISSIAGVELTPAELHAFERWIMAKRSARSGRLAPLEVPLPETHEDWLELRRGFIGSSDVPTVLGLNPYSGPWSLWAVKTGKISGEVDNKFTRLGNIMEPVILQLAAAELGVEVTKPAAMYRHPAVDCLSANLDGLAEDPLDPSRRVIVEAKHGGLHARAAIETLRDTGAVAPGSDVERWYYQIQEQLAVMGLEAAYLAVLVNKDFSCIRIPRDDDAIADIERECAAFWSRFVAGPDGPVAPPASAADLGALVTKARPEPGEARELDELAEDIDRETVIKAEIARLRKEKDAIDARVRQLLGDATAGTIAGAVRVKVTTSRRTSVDWKAVREKAAALVQQHEKTTKSTRLDYKKAATP